jgi:hypothetical protein
MIVKTYQGSRQYNHNYHVEQHRDDVGLYYTVHLTRENTTLYKQMAKRIGKDRFKRGEAFTFASQLATGGYCGAISV